MRQRVQDARVATLGTIAPDGGPHLVPITFVLDGDTMYWVVDDKPKTTAALQRLENMRVDPRVTVLVNHYTDDWSKLWWVRMEGSGSIVDDGPVFERVIDALAVKYDVYQRRRPAGPVVAIDVTKWRGWVSQLGV